MASSLMLTVQLQERRISRPIRCAPSRASRQAIGFIAAGVIFVRGANVVNMTTAANIWVAGAIGIACGAGQYRLVDRRRGARLHPAHPPEAGRALVLPQDGGDKD